MADCNEVYVLRVRCSTSKAFDAVEQSGEEISEDVHAVICDAPYNTCLIAEL